MPLHAAQCQRRLRPTPYRGEDVHQRLQQGNTRLEPHEWKSGEHLWLIDIIAPFGQRDEMFAELTLNVIKEQTVNCLP